MTISAMTTEKLQLMKELSVLFVLTATVLALYIPSGFRTLPLAFSLVYIFMHRMEICVDKDLKIWLLAFLFFVLIFTLSAENISSARKGLYDIFRGCIYFLPGYYFGKRLLTNKQYSWLLMLVFILLAGNYFIYHEPVDFYGYHQNPNNTAFGVALLMIFMLPILFSQKIVLVNIVIGSIGIITGLALLYAANSRSTWVALFISFMALTMIHNRKNSRLIVTLVILQALLLGIVLFYFNHKGFAMPVRIAMWNELIDHTINNHIWLGYGINNTKELLVALGLPALMAHNLFVDVFVSTGLIGLMIFLFLSIACAWIFCNKNYNITTVFYIGISGFVMFGFISMFDLKFAGLQFIGVVAYFLGVIYSQSRSKLESGR
jgi:hypothetical protein